MEDFCKMVEMLRQEVGAIENCAQNLTVRFQTQGIRAEILKVEILKRALVERAKSSARRRGFQSMAGDSNKVTVGLAAAGLGMLFGAVLMGDGVSALASGMSGFDGAVREMGRAKWAVSLDEDLLVVPRGEITRGHTWVTAESLLSAIEDLKERAQRGELYGNLHSIIEILKQKPSNLAHLLAVSQWVALPRNESAGG